MSILVTGAAGFIGSHLTERFLDAGEEVIGLDSFDTFYDPSAKERNLARARECERFTEVRGDIRDRGVYERLPDGVSTVIHLAARAGVRPSIRDPELYFDVNLRGTLLLLDWMSQRRISRLVFGSSSSVYGNSAPVPFSEEDVSDRPISPYAATKRAGELLVHSHGHLFGIDAICLRFFTVYGPRQRPDLAIHAFARTLSDGRAIQMYGDGSSGRDYTYIDDIVDGIRRAVSYLERNSDVYEIVNLGGARTVSLRDMIEKVAAAIGARPSIVPTHEQAGDVRRTAADLSKAQRLLGYSPTVPFEEGLRRFAEWFAAERAGASVPTLRPRRAERAGGVAAER